jgi:hypothetical protein
MPSAILQSILVPGRVARFGVRAFGEFLVYGKAQQRKEDIQSDDYKVVTFAQPSSWPR